MNPKMVPCWRHRILHFSRDGYPLTNLNYNIGKLTASTSRPVDACFNLIVKSESYRAPPSKPFLGSKASKVTEISAVANS
mmetsp:Transcript_25640/g.35697  ORF Transcript_25640/g.35697 Transcript_25640/m.35697 type:complete len:80 (-) Transcript_25640:286-525(-)